MKRTLLITLMMLAITGTASAELNTARAVNAIIGEAEGESYKGKYYLACALRNRGTFSGVYGEKSKRVIYKMYSRKIYAECLKAWEASKDNTTITATHWGGVVCDKERIANVKSSGKYKNFVQVDNQIFFEEIYDRYNTEQGGGDQE